MVLRDVTDCLTKPVEFIFRNRLTADRNGTVLDIEFPEQNFQQRRFPTSGFPDDAERFSFWQVKMNVT